jgi:hypothetical protein
MKTSVKTLPLTTAIAMFAMAYAPTVGAQTYGSCPVHGCIKVTTTNSGGSGCTVSNAVAAINAQRSVNGCTYPSGATGVQIPYWGSGTTYTVNQELVLSGASGVSIAGYSPTKTILSFPSNSAGIAIDVTSQQASAIQFLGISGASGNYLTGVQSESGASLTLSTVQVSGFESTGAVNFGTLIVHFSTFKGNAGGGEEMIGGNSYSLFGGGICNLAQGTVFIDTSLITGNTGIAGGGIYEAGGGTQLAYSTVSKNTAEVGGGIYVNSGAEWKAWHDTVILNTASNPYNAVPCGVGGGVFAADGNNADMDWNGSILAGNVDGTPQADDLVGSLHASSLLTDGANMSIVGNPQLGVTVNGQSCQVGGWQWNDSGNIPYHLPDTTATMTALFGSNNPALTSNPSSAPTQNYALASGNNPALASCTNNTMNLDYYGVNAPSTFAFPSVYTSGALKGQNSIDQGGQSAPKGGNGSKNLYCAGSFEHQ